LYRQITDFIDAFLRFQTGSEAVAKALGRQAGAGIDEAVAPKLES
jgi:hypothetical protein